MNLPNKHSKDPLAHSHPPSDSSLISNFSVFSYCSWIPCSNQYCELNSQSACSVYLLCCFPAWHKGFFYYKVRFLAWKKKRGWWKAHYFSLQICRERAPIMPMFKRLKGQDFRYNEEFLTAIKVVQQWNELWELWNDKQWFFQFFVCSDEGEEIVHYEDKQISVFNRS